VKGILEYKSLKANEYFAKKAQESANNMEAMTREMRITAEKTERETVSMRVITSVTLFFLPATFLAVSFVLVIMTKNANECAELPATALTFIAWGIIYFWAKKSR
jgi:uncharacterized membrane protein